MGDENDARNEREEVTVIFREPRVRPGTPEATELGCLCRFEANMEAAFLAAERGDTENTIVVIHKDCPLHTIVTKPMDDVLGGELDDQ